MAHAPGSVRSIYPQKSNFSFVPAKERVALPTENTNIPRWCLAMLPAERGLLRPEGAPLNGEAGHVEGLICLKIDILLLD